MYLAGDLLRHLLHLRTVYGRLHPRLSLSDAGLRRRRLGRLIEKVHPYIQDAARWFAILRADRRFDRVFVVGHSEGALIGMIAAQRVDVSAVVAIEGTSIRASDLIRALGLNWA